MGTYADVAAALTAAAAMAAAGSSGAAAADGGGGSSGSSAPGLLPVASVGGGGGGSVGSAAGSAARVAAAVAAAAGWGGLPLWRHSLLPGEEVTAIKCVELKETTGVDLQEGAGQSTTTYIAVATASAFGEDYPALGRLLLVEVRKHTPFDIKTKQSARIVARLALQKELPGPVMSVECLRGFLILAVGYRLEMHFKQGNTLVKMGQFIDCPSLVSGISIVKDFLLVGSAAHSARFLRYKEDVDRVTRERTQNMLLLSSDVARVESWAVEFLVNHTKLLQVVADGGGNLSVLMYDKADTDSWDGQKLLRRGAAHTGAWLTGLTRMKLAVPDATNRQALLGASAQGGLLLLSPFWEEAMFRRMTSLYEELVYRLAHTAGLNPKAFAARYARAGPAYGAGFWPIEPLRPGDNVLLQGDVLWAFLEMDARAQAAVAMAVGCDVGDLLRDLRELSTAASFL